MSDEAIIALMRRAPFGFIGTVEQLGAATMSNVPVDERTAVVRVDHVLHAPPSFTSLEEHSITVQLAKDAPPPAVGETLVFFAEGLAFGDSVAVTEVGRLPVEAVEPHVTRAMEAGEPGSLAALQRRVAADVLREHVDKSDAVVVGRVVKLENVLEPAAAEHDPDWWRATIDVLHVEQGKVKAGEVMVLYPNSLDVQWHKAPKPKASQGGVWILHATKGALRKVAPFQNLHPEDYQPVQSLDALRGTKG